MLISAKVVSATDQNINQDEYVNWVEENVDPIVYHGVNKDGNRPESIQEWIYTGSRSHTVYNGLGDVVGWMETEAKWLVNESQKVLDYDTVTFTHGVADSTVVSHPYFESAWMDTNNVRLIYQVDFVSWAGRFSIMHIYNLHGNGEVSFRVAY